MGLESLEMTFTDAPECPLSMHCFVFVITQLEGALINYCLRPIIFKKMSVFNEFFFLRFITTSRSVLNVL